ncbi:60S ribosomal protein L7a [Tetranychus urticae]|uniref:60S ribosomal protein L7a n=1 Tax=Tetranychus urticae TaxID=32264 RepID=T1K8W4_TETUR|nr:60S ribosomal protein L7a [Tetranychus urticae]
MVVKKIKIVRRKKVPPPPPPVVVQPKKTVVPVIKEKKKNPLIQKRPKNFGIGQDIQPKRDLTRFVRWPRYILLQRKRAILNQRIKVPPSVNQFRACNLDKQTAIQLFRLLEKYRPEDKRAKKLRLRAIAKEKAAGKKVTPQKRPPTVRFGCNKVTSLVEQKKAALVIIAADVDPIEIVLHLPTLCRKMGIPYCIVKGGRSRLGYIVRRKSIACCALVNVNPEDKNNLAKLCETIKTNFNDRYEEMRKQWGGGVLSFRSRAKQAKLEKAKAKELQQQQSGGITIQ